MTFTGSAGLHVAASDAGDNDGYPSSWMLNASFPLAGSVPASASQTYGVWVPSGSTGAFRDDLGGTAPSYLDALMPGSSLLESGASGASGGTTEDWTCPANGSPEGVWDGLQPDLVESSSGSAVSLTLSFTGGLTPGEDGQGGGNVLTCSSGQSASSDGGEFQVVTPDGANPAAQTTTIKVGFSGLGSGANQHLNSTNESVLPTDQSTNLSCFNSTSPSSTCTTTWSQAPTVALTLTKVCTGMFAVSSGIGSGTCGSTTPPTKPGQPKITKAVINSQAHTASFTFTATKATSYKCELVTPQALPKPKFSSCTSPKKYSRLKAGRYTFKVDGVNSAGVGSTLSRAFKIT